MSNLESEEIKIAILAINKWISDLEQTDHSYYISNRFYGLVIQTLKRLFIESVGHEPTEDQKIELFDIFEIRMYNGKYKEGLPLGLFNKKENEAINIKEQEEKEIQANKFKKFRRTSGEIYITAFCVYQIQKMLDNPYYILNYISDNHDYSFIPNNELLELEHNDREIQRLINRGINIDYSILTRKGIKFTC